MTQTLGSTDHQKSLLVGTTPPKKTPRATIILDISDISVCAFLREAALPIRITLVDAIDREKLIGYDACLTDGKSGIDLVSLMQHGIVPIVTSNHPLISSLREFDPMRFEGNAFIAESLDMYLIFEKLIRYLENIRYSGDKKVLLNNVKKTF